MSKRYLASAALFLSGVVLAGCGGGASKSSSMSRTAIRNRAIATTRVARATFAIAGLGRHITRAPRIGMGRAGLFLAALRHTRDVVASEGMDMDTGLFFTLTTAADGSGQQHLFTDSAHTHAAGQYVWSAPQWKDGQPDSYPVVLHEEFSITDGDFAGDRGTADSTLTDATGNNGTIHLTFTDAKNETAVCDLTIVDGKVSAQDTVTLPDSTTYIEEDVTMPNGEMDCTITFPDGSKEVEIMAMDGTGTETFTDPGGKVEESGTFQSDGSETLNFDDGTTETVDVDTADTSSSSGDAAASALRRPSGRP